MKTKVQTNYDWFLIQAVDWYRVQKAYMMSMAYNRGDVYIVDYSQLIAKDNDTIDIHNMHWMKSIPIEEDVDKWIIDWGAGGSRKKKEDFDRDFYREKKYLQHLTNEEIEYISKQNTIVYDIYNK